MRYKNGRKHTSPIWKLDKETLVQLIQESTTIGEVLHFFGLKNHGSNYKTLMRRLSHDRIDASKFSSNFGRGLIRPLIPLEDILVEHSTYNRTNLKQRLIKEGILENRCAECGLGPEWNEKSLVLVLDHTNGINDDNTLSNLRLLCPNCNSQTSTFAGRNKPQKHVCVDCGRKISKTASRCSSCDKKNRGGKVERPSRKSLEVLLWTEPTSHIARRYGVSDQSVAKWAKSYGIAKPPRGYWSKNKIK